MNSFRISLVFLIISFKVYNTFFYNNLLKLNILQIILKSWVINIIFDVKILYYELYNNYCEKDIN